MTRIFTDDIQKLAEETGLSREEARRLLLRANGDYRKALRMHQEAFTVYVEPDRVEDAPDSAKARAARALDGVFRAIRHMAGSIALRRTLLLIVVLFALTRAPQVSGFALLVLLMLRLAGARGPAAASAANS